MLLDLYFSSDIVAEVAFVDALPAALLPALLICCFFITAEEVRLSGFFISGLAIIGTLLLPLLEDTPLLLLLLLEEVLVLLPMALELEEVLAVLLVLNPLLTEVEDTDTEAEEEVEAEVEAEEVDSPIIGLAEAMAKSSSSVPIAAAAEEEDDDDGTDMDATKYEEAALVLETLDDDTLDDATLEDTPPLPPTAVSRPTISPDGFARTSFANPSGVFKLTSQNGEDNFFNNIAVVAAETGAIKSAQTLATCAMFAW